MSIKRESWHYRILLTELKNDTDREARSKELTKCKYYWRVLLSIFIYNVWVLLGACFTFVALSLVYLTGYMWYYGLTVLIVDGLNYDMTMVRASTTINGIMFFLWCGVMLLISERCEPVRAYIGRVKNKMCKPVTLE